MNVKSLRLVYFSATGTTRTVVRSIAEGIGLPLGGETDLTRPEARALPFEGAADELIIVAMPVFMGRVPECLTSWFDSAFANGSPTVCVAVYGNKTYGDTLLELKNLLSAHGFRPFAYSAFIGEHSFSSSKTPIAAARPDAGDLELCRKFGGLVADKLGGIESAAYVNVPGEFPYSGSTKLWDVDFIEVDESCVQCGHCASVCPVEAIDRNDSRKIDIVKCITCCACIKGCPNAARSMKDSPVKTAAGRLNQLFSERREPEWFI